MVKLNLGCGSNKIEGCVNIDVETSCNPDLVCNFLKDPLPYERHSVGEAYLFHTIEHIQKGNHRKLLREIHRVLTPGGLLLISYPEFLKCVENWKSNKNGNRDFWEATLYGRQLYPSDFHVCIMDSDEFRQVLLQEGFLDVKYMAEPAPNEFNTIVSCKRGMTPKAYEDVVSEEIDNLIFQAPR